MVQQHKKDQGGIWNRTRGERNGKINMEEVCQEEDRRERRKEHQRTVQGQEKSKNGCTGQVREKELSGTSLVKGCKKDNKMQNAYVQGTCEL